MDNTFNVYDLMSGDEFNERLDAKLDTETRDNLIAMLRQYAHDEINETYNNEILADWLSEQACALCDGALDESDDLARYHDGAADRIVHVACLEEQD